MLNGDAPLKHGGYNLRLRHTDGRPELRFAFAPGVVAEGRGVTYANACIHVCI